MTTYNDIGIASDLDWDRIRHLLKIGIFASILVLIGDMLMGWGSADPALTGTAGELSAYLEMSDTRIFWASILGFVGIPLEGLCYFAIYRVIAPYSQKLAHLYRSGIFGYIAFGGCGVHVPCLARIFFYKSMLSADPEAALPATETFTNFFLVPGTLVLLIFVLILSVSHILAFAKGLTPYPRWCWIFCLPMGMIATEVFTSFSHARLANAISNGWISVANLWMFVGLFLLSKKAEKSASLSSKNEVFS